MKEIFKLIVILLIAFFATHYFLEFFLYMSNKYISKYGIELNTVTLLMPTIVMSAAFIALLNLRETSENNKETIEWKAKERTLDLLDDFEKIVETFNQFYKDDFMYDYFDGLGGSINDYEGAVTYVRLVREKKQHEEYNEYLQILNQLRIASNLYEHMAIQYNHQLLNRSMFKELYYPTLKSNAFYQISIIKGYFTDSSTSNSELIKLLEDLGIDYKEMPQRR